MGTVQDRALRSQVEQDTPQAHHSLQGVDRRLQTKHMVQWVRGSALVLQMTEAGLPAQEAEPCNTANHLVEEDSHTLEHQAGGSHMRVAQSQANLAGLDTAGTRRHGSLCRLWVLLM